MSTRTYPKYKDSGVEWLGQVPEHWEIIQSRRMFAQRRQRALKLDQQLTASQKHGVIYQTDFTALENQKVVQVIHGADILKHVEPNDFVISMRSFQGGIEWCGLSGSISSAYVMLTATKDIEVGFFRALFKSIPYIRALQSTSNLVRDGQALRFENFALVPLLVPPLAEQRAIAAFLDREIARLDTLIARQERLIELSLEKRRALISHTVTRGLNANTPLKDSGVEWLGQVPQHWEVKRLKYLVSRVGSGKTPRGGSEVYKQEGVIFLRSQNIHFDGLRLEDVVYIDEETDEEMRLTRVQGDDILLNITGASLGRCAVVPTSFPNSANVNQHVCIVRPVKQKVEPKFLHASMASNVVQVQIFSGENGSSREGLNFSSIANLNLVLPPLSEQRAIVEYLDAETAKIDTLISKARRAIELMREHRTSLIAAAVTGKIDVRHLVAS